MRSAQKTNPDQAAKNAKNAKKDRFTVSRGECSSDAIPSIDWDL